MTYRRFVSGAAAIAVMICIAGCSKDPGPKTPAQGRGPQGQPGPGAAAQKPPAPKPQGPLQSEPGTRMARLETTPNGRFIVTVLSKNRQEVEAIAEKELECNVTAEGKSEAIKLVARPSEAETKENKCSAFLGFSNDLVNGKAAIVVVTFPTGEPRLATFKVPAGYRTF